MRLAVSVVAMILAPALVASAQAPSKDPAASAACSYFTKDDAAAALGDAVTGPKATAMPDRKVSACEYEGSGIHRVNVVVRVFDASTAAAYKAICAKKGKEGLTGLGDTTCWYNDKHEELQVLKGTTFFSIELRRSGDPTDAIKTLAKKIYDRVKP
jgi:hypothetical protein